MEEVQEISEAEKRSKQCKFNERRFDGLMKYFEINFFIDLLNHSFIQPFGLPSIRPSLICLFISLFICIFLISRLDSFRLASFDIGLITKVFVEMYNTGQSKKWFLEKVRKIPWHLFCRLKTSKNHLLKTNPVKQCEEMSCAVSFGKS